MTDPFQANADDPSPTDRIPVPGAADPGAADPAASDPGASVANPPQPAPAPTTGPTSPAPGWRPAQRDDGRTASIVFGLIVLAIGLWFFAGQTLGLDLPTIRFSQLWPLILIGVGLWIVLGTWRRRG